ncbi:MAG: hypothetical protein PHP11_07275 [Erysipelotrichaceae bacterium]|nr:hypothetical protein [Erysipelotrichaceae bacterium]MDD4643037.1 hypothetical protein [Erysipelotrichaceae bacterium]
MKKKSSKPINLRKAKEGIVWSVILSDPKAYKYKHKSKGKAV